MASPVQEQPPSVRLGDKDEDIDPKTAVQGVCDITSIGNAPSDGPLSAEAEQELRNLSKTLQKSRCQARRMENFSFEPVSLPSSRVSIVLSMEGQILD